MPRIDLSTVPERRGSGYPAPYAEAAQSRIKQALADAGGQPLRAGDCAAFPKNVADGHHLINRGSETAVYLEVGTRSADDACHYPDIDLYVEGDEGYVHKVGTPY